MRVAFRLVALAVLSGWLAVPTRWAAAQDKAPEQRRTIAVSSTGEVSATPDLAVLSVAVETTAAKAGDAVTENAARSAKVASALRGLLAKEDKLTTTSYSLEPRYEPAKRGEPGE